jgi:hypothetical protein
MPSKFRRVKAGTFLSFSRGGSASVMSWSPPTTSLKSTTRTSWPNIQVFASVFGSSLIVTASSLDEICVALKASFLGMPPLLTMQLVRC